jgi:F-type H+-transporting ATPase subunit b
VLTAVVTRQGVSSVSVEILLPRAADETQAGEEELDEGPSPIAPEGKELLWGGGAFVVFAVLMRLYLYPKLKQGMNDRYASIRAGHESADAARAAAQAEVDEYQAQLAVVKAEGAARIDAARQALDAERTVRLAEANAAAAAKRAAAADRAEAERAAARDEVRAAVESVATRATELAIGRRPDPAAVARAVDDVLSAGVAR